MSEAERKKEVSELALPPVGPRAHVRVGARVLTMELAEKFADILLSNVSHSVESAALAAGLRPSTVTDAISRYRADKCKTLADEAVCEAVLSAKLAHVSRIREYGYISAAGGNRAGTAWMQWQLEVVDPLNHPRRQVEVSAAVAVGSGDAAAMAQVRYVIAVPPDEQEDE